MCSFTEVFEAVAIRVSLSISLLQMGISWLFKLHRHPVGGGILGDDMGLGKTIQVSFIVNAMQVAVVVVVLLL
tara:strand:+ start:630 stop:848 length:219 start_codon:yes stop_codon:yes gene_type:complete